MSGAGPGLLPAAIAFVVATALAWIVIVTTDWLAGYPVWTAPMFGALAFLVVRVVAGVITELRR